MGEAIVPKKKFLLSWGEICNASSKEVIRPYSGICGSEG
jgi:hypothetical protein